MLNEKFFASTFRIELLAICVLARTIKYDLKNWNHKELRIVLLVVKLSLARF